MSKMHTTEWLVNKMKDVNPGIQILGQYTGYNQKIKYQCEKGHINYAAPASLLKNHGCRICNGGVSKTHDEFVKQVEFANVNTRVLGTYVNHHTPILCKCLIHNVEFTAWPVSLLRGGGCTLCRDEKAAQERKKSIEQFIRELKEVNPKIKVLGKTYKNAHTPILCKCLDCGWEWMPTPHNVLRKEGCPKCNNRKFSIGEELIENFLKKHNLSYSKQYGFKDCKDKKKLLFDFVVFHNNQLWCLIEFDGRQHYEPVCFDVSTEINLQSAKIDYEKTVKHDQIKNSYCASHSYQLIRIPYWDLENIDNILFEKLKDIL